jgi:hypothetical protein
MRYRAHDAVLLFQHPQVHRTAADLEPVLVALLAAERYTPALTPAGQVHAKDGHHPVFIAPAIVAQPGANQAVRTRGSGSRAMTEDLGPEQFTRFEVEGSLATTDFA